MTHLRLVKDPSESEEQTKLEIQVLGLLCVRRLATMLVTRQPSWEARRIVEVAESAMRDMMDDVSPELRAAMERLLAK